LFNYEDGFKRDCACLHGSYHLFIIAQNSTWPKKIILERYRTLQINGSWFTVFYNSEVFT